MAIARTVFIISRRLRWCGCTTTRPRRMIWGRRSAKRMGFSSAKLWRRPSAGTSWTWTRCCSSLSTESTRRMNLVRSSIRVTSVFRKSWRFFVIAAAACRYLWTSTSLTTTGRRPKWSPPPTSLDLGSWPALRCRSPGGSRKLSLRWGRRSPRGWSVTGLIAGPKKSISSTGWKHCNACWSGGPAAKRV